MNSLNFAFITLSLVLTLGAQAQSADDTPIDDAGNGETLEQDLRQGLFPSEEPVEKQEEQEDPEFDSFGEDRFNQNRAPEEFTIDDEY